jgi:hypothetical protein
MREARWWGQVRLLAALTVFLSLIAVAPVWGTIRYGDFQLSGNFESFNSMRHPSEQDYHFIGNRNTFRARVDWDWLKDGNFLGKFDIPWIESSKLYLLYRGVYDSFYDIAPHDLQIGQTKYDDIVGGRISSVRESQRDAFKWDNTLREAYIDTKFRDIPLTLRTGRQQVIWGESDNFRLGDIWNPLDFTWHAQQDSWEQLRIPMWLIKGLWDFGQLGPLSNAFLEVVYNPGDYHATKLAFLPRPWSVPYPNALRAGQVAFNPASPANPEFWTSSTFNTNGTSLEQGDFSRNPADASEVGARFHFVTPQGLELSMNYLYGRGRGPIAMSGNGFKIDSITIPASTIPFLGGTPIGTYQRDINDPNSVVPVGQVLVNGKFIHPYANLFGLNGNYFDGDYTQAVLRWEMLYGMALPVTTEEAKYQVPINIDLGGGALIPAGASSPSNFAKRDVWGGMIGFDRPTWIRFLNNKNTFFLTYQFFWQYILGGNFDKLIGSAGVGDSGNFGPIGQWVTGPYTNQVERQAFGPPGDKVYQWETLMTFAASTFYWGGTLQPLAGQALDLTNSDGQTFWSADYFVTNNLILQLAQKFYYSYGSNLWPHNDPWFSGGRFARRDETTLKVTYQY